MKKISGLFIVYIIVLLFPVWGICLDKIQAPLNGTVSQETIPKVDIKKIMNGEYQYELDNYLLSVEANYCIHCLMYLQTIML